jgi:DNA-binding response OmpR family regulator
VEPVSITEQERKTVLLVDDSPTELKIMINALRGQGYRILTASDGQEALDVAVEQRPEVVLLDVILPKKNGYQVVRQLKSFPGLEKTRVVLVSSRSQEKDKEWGLLQGADDYLVKPYTVASLRASIEGANTEGANTDGGSTESNDIAAGKALQGQQLFDSQSTFENHAAFDDPTGFERQSTVSIQDVSR